MLRVSAKSYRHSFRCVNFAVRLEPKCHPKLPWQQILTRSGRGQQLVHSFEVEMRISHGLPVWCTFDSKHWSEKFYSKCVLLTPWLLLTRTVVIRSLRKYWVYCELRYDSYHKSKIAYPYQNYCKIYSKMKNMASTLSQMKVELFEFFSAKSASNELWSVPYAIYAETAVSLGFKRRTGSYKVAPTPFRRIAVGPLDSSASRHFALG